MTMNAIILRIFLLALLPLSALAKEAAKQTTGIGGVAVNLMSPVGVFSDLIQTGCFIIGGSFLFASLIKYIEHRRSPLMVPISTVVFLFLAGLILIGLPFLSYFLDYAVPFSFMK
jgi:hypothetical protein